MKGEMVGRPPPPHSWCASVTVRHGRATEDEQEPTAWILSVICRDLGVVM